MEFQRVLTSRINFFVDPSGTPLFVCIFLSLSEFITLFFTHLTKKNTQVPTVNSHVATHVLYCVRSPTPDGAASLAKLV